MVKYLVLLIVCVFSLNQSFCQYVALADDVTPEMLDPQFWCKQKKRLMNLSEIESWNRRQIDDTLFSEYSGKESIDPGLVLKRINFANSFQKVLYDNVGKMIPDSVLKAYEANLNLDSIEGKVGYGIITKHTEVRKLPTCFIAYQDSDNIFFDDFIVSAVYVNEPVLILHSSLDGNWFFIATKCFEGWIPKYSVAICSSYEKWKSNCEGDFLLITANRLYLPVEPLQSETSSLELSMGCKLRLVSSPVEGVSGRHAQCSYAVEIPTRDSLGMLDYKFAYVPYNSDVNIGYLDYNRSSVLKQAFKMLGDRYGWGGIFHSRDCSLFIMDIYRCFGICTGRNSMQIANMNTEVVDFSQMTTDAKFRTIKSKLQPGDLLYFKGHIAMYIGTKNNKAYIINSVSSFKYNGRKTYVQSVVVNSLDALRMRGTFLESVEKGVKIVL